MLPFPTHPSPLPPCPLVGCIPPTPWHPTWKCARGDGIAWMAFRNCIRVQLLTHSVGCGRFGTVAVGWLAMPSGPTGGGQRRGGTISILAGSRGEAGSEGVDHQVETTCCEASSRGATFCIPRAGTDQAGQDQARAHSHPEPTRTGQVPSSPTSPRGARCKGKQPRWMFFLPQTCQGADGGGNPSSQFLLD